MLPPVPPKAIELADRKFGKITVEREGNASSLSRTCPDLACALSLTLSARLRVTLPIPRPFHSAPRLRLLARLALVARHAERLHVLDAALATAVAHRQLVVRVPAAPLARRLG